MKSLLRIPFVLIALFFFLPSCASTQVAKKPDLPVSVEERHAYAMGVDVGRALKEAMPEMPVDFLLRGVESAFDRLPMMMTPEELDESRAEGARIMQEKMAETQERMALANLEDGDALLEDNRNRKGVVETASGLQYEVLEKGEGEKPEVEDFVKIHYRGTLTNGSTFFDTHKTGHPVVFQVGTVIPGWQEGLLLMNEGSRYRFHIPPRLGFGPRGSGAIGPNAVLIVDMELLDINPENEE